MRITGLAGTASMKRCSRARFASHVGAASRRLRQAVSGQNLGEYTR